MKELFFLFWGVVFFILAYVLKKRDDEIQKNCTQLVKGKVIRYPVIGYSNSVYCPIVKYIVNDISYTQRLKYTSTIMKDRSLIGKCEQPDDFDIYSSTLVLCKYSPCSVYNPVEKKFPVGSEIDVFYNPANPKQSYVLRFLENIYKKVFVLLGFFNIIIIMMIFFTNA